MKIYYDHAATTKQLPAVTRVMCETAENSWYNISSGYTPSFEARKILTQAREYAGKLICAKSENIIFTSGATEANNMVLKGIRKINENSRIHIISTTIEHPAVYETLLDMKKEGVEVSFVKPGKDGSVSVKDIEKEIKDNTVLISVMFANNETGVIQPVAEIGSLAHENGILFHTDAVQALGHVDIDVDAMNIDFLSASAHKMYGPKGMGFLYIRNSKSIRPLFCGGGQQSGLRSGTVNNEGIAGYGFSLKYALENMHEDNRRVTAIRDFFEENLLKELPGTCVNGDRKNRICSTTSMSFPLIEAESLIMTLDMKGILVSGGSACATGSSEPSRVLTQMGLSAEAAKGTIRFSFGIDNTMEEAKKAVEIVVESVRYLQSVRL